MSAFSLVSYKFKNDVIKQLIPINLYEEKAYLENPKAFVDKKYGIDATVIMPCVKYNTLVSVDGFRMHISKKSNDTIGYKPAMQLILSSDFEKYIKKVVSYLNKCDELKKEKEITEHDGITAEDNLKLYRAICDKVNNTLLNVKFKNIAKIMLEKQEVFEELSLKNQCDVIMEILKILHSNVVLGDLHLLKEAKNCGAVTTNSKISPSKNIKSFKIINQSITGLFEQEIELLN